MTDLGKNIGGGGPGIPYVEVVIMGDNTVHLEGLGRIPPHGGLQAYGVATSEGGGGIPRERK